MALAALPPLHRDFIERPLLDQASVNGLLLITSRRHPRDLPPLIAEAGERAAWGSVRLLLMSASPRSSGYHYVVDEALLGAIAAEIQAAIPGADVRLFGSRARGSARPDSDLDLLVTVPDAWLATHSRSEATDALGWKLAHHRLPIELLLYSTSEVEQQRHGRINVIAEAFRYGRRLTPAQSEHGAR